MADNIIELRHISKVYSDNGFKAVDDFNLEVKRGEFVTFLGPSVSPTAIPQLSCPLCCNASRP